MFFRRPDMKTGTVICAWISHAIFTPVYTSSIFKLSTWVVDSLNKIIQMVNFEKYFAR